MNSFFLRHVEKFLFLVILLACGYWASASLKAMKTSPANDRELQEAVATIEQKLNGPATWHKDVGPYIARVDKTVNPSVEAMPVPDHVFFWLPPMEVGNVVYLDGVLPAPSDLSAVAKRGQIVISWSLSGVQGCVPDRFEIYRRKEGEEGFPKKPYATVMAEWPEPAFKPEPSAVGARPPVSMPAPARQEEQPSGKDIKKDYQYTDNNVEAKTTYYYRVRVWGKEFTREQLEAGGWKKLVRPANVTVVERDGATYWVSGLSGMAEARTPSNIRLVYKGAFGTAPHWKARITVREWRSDIRKWVEGTALVAQGDRIVGQGTLRIKNRPVNVRIDSGYVLVKIIEETRHRTIRQSVMGEEREIQVPYVYKAVEVKDVETGQVELVEAGKEEKMEEDLGPAPEEGSTGAEASETTGGRRRRRIK